jgi:uncharacterized membrane protein
MELVQGRHVANIHKAERIASVIAGGALGIFGIREGLKRHSIPGASLALAGAALVKRGITGYCDLYRSLGVDTTGRKAARVERSITINASREEVYAFCRNPENLPRFVKQVRCIKKAEWNAEIIQDVPNELLAWRSAPGSPVERAGSVRFDHAAAGRGTTVSVALILSGRDCEREVAASLQRLKSIIEAGEVPISQVEPVVKSAARQTEEVHDASEASFPASDAPSYSHVVTQ